MNFKKDVSRLSHLKSVFKTAALASVTGVIFAGSFSAWKIYEEYHWNPVDMSSYTPGFSDNMDIKHPARALSAFISEFNKREGTFTGRSAFYHAVILDAYHHVLNEYGLDEAIFTGYKLLAVLDQESAENFISGFQEIDLQMSFDTRPYIAKLEYALSKKGVVPVVPDKDVVWSDAYGVRDPDSDIWSWQYKTLDYRDLPSLPVPPNYGSYFDRADKYSVFYAGRFVNNRQRENIMYWQGGQSFTKSTSFGSYSAVDNWQSIFYEEVGKDLSEKEYVEVAKELAWVIHDASVACWKVKYKYWTPRPIMRNPEVQRVIGEPPFPGFVSGHATSAGAAAAFLSRKFPEKSDVWWKIAQDSSFSRLYAGIHMHSDNVEGLRLGALIGGVAFASEQEIAKAVFDYKAAARTDAEGFIQYTSVKMLDWGVKVYDSIVESYLEIVSEPIEFRSVEQLLPWPSTDKEKPRGTQSIDLQMGSIAIRDLNTDNLPEVLVSGRDSVKLYRNLGRMQFEQMAEFKVDGVVGAYFTHSSAGKVDGIIAFGKSKPVWFDKESDFTFISSPFAISNLPAEDLYSYGVMPYDFDNDGDEDLLVLNYGEILLGEGDSEDAQGAFNYLLQRSGDKFMAVGDPVSKEKWATFAGGIIDINKDGTNDIIYVNDGFPLEAYSLGGLKNESFKFSGDAKLPPSGMSYTPFYMGKEQNPVVHVSSIFYGEDYLFGDRQPGEFADHDLILKWDESSKTIIDASNKDLNKTSLEWRWGSSAGDLNGDGLSDLVLAEGYIRTTQFAPAIRIMTQNPDGTFDEYPQELLPKLGDFSPRSVVLDDLDQDGDLDIIASSGFDVRLWENTSGIAPQDKKDPLWIGKPSGFLSQPRN